MHQRWKKDAIRYLWMVVACFLFGSAVGIFLAPNGIVTGGVTGLGTVINLFSGISIGTVSLLLNIPILLGGLRIMGRRFILDCLITSTVLSLAVDLTGMLPPITHDRIIACLYGGLLLGVSIGLFYKYQVSSGGTELLARILMRWRFRHVSIGTMLGVLDGIVVLIGAIAMKNPENVLYALIVIFLSSQVSNVVITGLRYARLCYIITQKPEDVAAALIARLPRGVTLMDGKGMYTQTPLGVLMTAVKNSDFTAMKDTVRQVDPNAFVIVAEAAEVLGQGFRPMNDDHANP